MAFGTDYLANLTADLTVKLLEAVGRAGRKALAGDEATAALHHCVQSGVVALVATATTAEPEDKMLLETIFTNFFAD